MQQQKHIDIHLTYVNIIYMGHGNCAATVTGIAKTTVHRKQVMQVGVEIRSCHLGFPYIYIGFLLQPARTPDVL